MTALRAAAARRKALAAWYAGHARPLPWRARPADPYRSWVSEIMLQQTRVSQGLPYYERFLKRFPTVRALADAPEADVLKAWEGLGYYRRAKLLHAAARAVAGDRGGRFPRTSAEWRTLPGVGRYTAGALASILAGERTPLVDGNVKRVFARWFARPEPMDKPAGDAWCWRTAEELLPPPRAGEPSPGDWNEALMELGALVCVPRGPACDACPVANWCAARKEGDPERYPVKTPRRRVPRVAVVAGALWRGGKLLFGRRPEGGMLAGLWELPGGKIEPGETPEAALVREWEEELGVRVRAGEKLGEVDHAFSHFTMTLALYRCRLVRGSPAPEPRKHAELRWVAPDAWDELALPKADRNLLLAIKAT